MKIILCITGSIAATEDLKLVHRLQRCGHDVECFMTPAACELITPLSMEFATKHPVVTKITGYVEHVTRARADLILVAPATANTISKFADKIADTPVTTLLLTASGYKTPVLFVPSMHISMYRAVESKIEEIKQEHKTVRFIEPVNADNKAKFPDLDTIILEVEKTLSDHKLKGLNMIITAGATFEAIDDMRGITNRSSGKMGVELAREAYIQGADVTLIHGTTSACIPGSIKTIEVESTGDMINRTKKIIHENDIFISAAAISDFMIDRREGKISSSRDTTIELKKLPKLLDMIKQLNPSIFTVGFKAEAGISEDQLIQKAREKIEKSGVDLMVANDILTPEAGAGSDKNEVYLVDKTSKVEKLDLDYKKHIAGKIIDRIYRMI